MPRLRASFTIWRLFSKAGAKVLLFFDIRKFLSNNFAKNVYSKRFFQKTEVISSHLKGDSVVPCPTRL